MVVQDYSMEEIILSMMGSRCGLDLGSKKSMNVERLFVEEDMELEILKTPIVPVD